MNVTEEEVTEGALRWARATCGRNARSAGARFSIDTVAEPDEDDEGHRPRLRRLIAPIVANGEDARRTRHAPSYRLAQVQPPRAGCREAAARGR